MILKKEKIYAKKVKGGISLQYRKRTTYFIFCIIPLYIKDEYISGDCEYERN